MQRSSKQTHDSNSSEVENNRKSLFADNPRVYTTSTDHLFESCFPPVSEQDFSAVSQCLVARGCICDSAPAASPTWLSADALPLQSPTSSELSEDSLFSKAIPAIFDNVMGAYCDVKSLTCDQVGIVHAVADGKRRMDSDIYASFRSDAAFMIRNDKLSDAEKKIGKLQNYMHVGVPGEFKKNKSGVGVRSVSTVLHWPE